MTRGRLTEVPHFAVFENVRQCPIQSMVGETVRRGKALDFSG
jgi:hypothetical protein